MDKVVVRELKLEDCEGVAAVAYRCLPERLTKEMIEDVLRYNHNHFFVAVDGLSGGIIGFSGMMQIVDEAELLYIAVMPEYRKRQVGQQLLDCVISTAQKGNSYRVLLEVRESNEGAASFYRKNEFRQIATRKEYYTNPIEDAIIMEKII